MIRNATITLLISLFFLMSIVQGQTFTAVTPSNHTVYFQIVNGAAEATFKTYGMPNYGSSIVGTLIIPDSVEYYGTWYPVTSIGYEAFHHSYYVDTVILPTTITEIKQEAFSACSNLASVAIPNSVTTLGWCSFCACHNLSDLTIGESVTTIGKQAFDADTSLVSVVIPNSVVSIGDAAFSQCYSLRTIIFGSSVSSIGYGTFTYCPQLDSLIFLSETAPSYGGGFYGGTPDTLNIIIPCGSYHSYSYWFGTQHKYTVPTVGFSMNVSSEQPQRGTADIVKDLDSNDVRCDSSVVIKATPNYGYHFHQWSNGSTNSQDTLFITGDSSISASFAKNQYSLTVHSFNTSLGTVTGDGVYDYLDTIIVTATATAPHYFFERWSDGSTESSHSVVITGNMMLTAYFAIDTHTVSVFADSIVYGSVSGGGRYTYGTVATLTAAPYSGFQFSHWSNGATYNPYIFAVVGDTSLTAYFYADGEPYQDTIYICDTVFIPIHDTSYVMVTDTLTDTLFVPVHDTLTLLDTIYLPQFFYDSIFVPVHDTTILLMNDTIVDTLWLSVHDTILLHDTLYLPQYIYDTIYIHDTLYVGINDVETINVKVFTNNGQIVVEGAEGNQVCLYDINGRLLATKQDNYQSLRFDVQASGTYLVKIGKHPARKVVIIR